MANKEFEQLIKKRREFVNSSKENNFDFDILLAGLYNDVAHFIYELLQNAEDAKNGKIKGAKKVRFELFEDRLDIYHDGADFDNKDIDGVTGIGISKKKDDLTSIGRFGVGFKSVFAVTKTPLIFSGEYKIRIDDFVIPSIVNIDKQISGTLISLPFNHNLRTKEEVFSIVCKKLENLGLKTLLFLKNIEEIRWSTPSSSGYYSKSSEPIQAIPNARIVTIKSPTVTEKYIVVEKPITIEDKKLRVEVAYKLGKDDDGKENIIPEHDSKLVVFFPTEKDTFLNFVIQGPYKTTPNRENIPLEDEQNKAIIEATGNLVAESLSIIKDLGYLNTKFLGILPIEPKDKHPDGVIYSVLYDKVKEKLLSEELLPTSDDKYIKASDALLARGKELTEFLEKKDIQELFSKKAWLDTNITPNLTPELREYLMREFNISEVTFESFARKLTNVFLQTKSDEWIITFYARLLEHKTLWVDNGILRTKPIIRLETNAHIAPFDDNEEVQVYLPTETMSEYKTVKRIITENQNSLKFLKELGLTEPDLFAEVEKFILPKYQKENPAKDELYFDDFEKLLRAWETIPANKKREFMEKLSMTCFIDSLKNGTVEKYLMKPSETYFSGKDLLEYFRGYPSAYFISDELYKKFGEERLKPFFIELGVEDKPRRIEIAGNLSWEEKYKLRAGRNCPKEKYQKDYEYEGLQNFIANMTIARSSLLWRLLLKNIEGSNNRDAQKFFEGEYCWFYLSDHSSRAGFDAKFIKALREQKWLVDKNKMFRKSPDIAFSELSSEYPRECPNIGVLIKNLGFMPEIIDQLPENDRQMLKLLKEKGLSIEDIEKLPPKNKDEETQEQEGDENSKWTPEIDPEKVDAKIIEVIPDKIATSDRKGQAGRLDSNENEGEKDENKNPTDEGAHETISSAKMKAIGDCGEKHVFCELKKMYQKQGPINETDFGFKTVNS